MTLAGGGALVVLAAAGQTASAAILAAVISYGVWAIIQDRPLLPETHEQDEPGDDAGDVQQPDEHLPHPDTPPGRLRALLRLYSGRGGRRGCAVRPRHGRATDSGQEDGSGRRWHDL